MSETIEAIKAAALKELEEEDFRVRVNAEKARLRERRKHWFPWKLTFRTERR